MPTQERIHHDDILVKNFVENPEYTRKFNIKKYVCKLIVTSIMHTIRTRLANGENVILPTVGKLVVVKCQPRPYVNPRTGEQSMVPEKHKVVFRPSGRLQKLLKAYSIEALGHKHSEDK